MKSISKFLVIIAILNIILLFAGISKLPQKEDWSNYSNDQIANAIYKAEGGEKTKYPYGVKSINTNGDEKYARQICLNSIRNSRKRWIDAGKSDDFIIFMSRRYAPIGAENDPGGLNKFWIKNVKWFLKND